MSRECRILKADKVQEILEKEIREFLSREGDFPPTLGILRLGEEADQISYERAAQRNMGKFGIQTRVFAYPAAVSLEKVEDVIRQINIDRSIHGLLILRPLPEHISEQRLGELLSPEKDMDGFSLENQNAVMKGESKNQWAPCTARAVMEILKAYAIPLEGKKVVVLGRSMVIGRPAAMMALDENATVTICHSKTTGLKEECRRADILIAAVGQAGMVQCDYIKEGAVVIDVGINYIEGKLVGDVDFSSVQKKAAALSPVPGGVGGVTNYILARNLARSYQNSLRE